MTQPSPRISAFVETAALYAVLNNDNTEAIRIVADMFPNERAAFHDQLSSLMTLLGERCDGCGELAPIGTGVLASPFDPDSRRFLCGSCAAKHRAGN